MSQAASSTSSSETERQAPGRRRLLALLAGAPAALALSGCGFRPVYGPQDSVSGASAPAPVRAVLASTFVAIIPERSGQLLRRSLQQRLGAAGSAAPNYELRVGLQLAAEPEGFRRDGTASRIRYNAIATWQLVTLGPEPATRAEGTERAFDSFNIPDNQFFAADFSRDATVQRLVEQLANDIVLNLSVRLRDSTV
ncbi:LPS assembly lipoprotein LptE [Pseudoroseomonas cervicalis]|uniref:LPS assembly lipoprotein LptE n=1 Tax=Teichococcus cervicalis TaxID=204525 RepID=UPI00278752F3|nr:LPS assembly lipoprotein LptE [Pseudoroseomonas cervicalis]MDQ1081049.1 LPS-assembly lipoprotein [Pseudoroseomonas cervicalis]